jgi:hypothetical protein
MFLPNSRYARTAVVDVRTTDGRTVKAIKLRRLPAVSGASVTVTDHDRLDAIAQRRYGEPTWFWHIADANTELDAQALVRAPRRTILVPDT